MQKKKRKKKKVCASGTRPWKCKQKASSQIAKKKISQSWSKLCMAYWRHDKLKPYGLSIHGCIDGYSRRIIWLEVASTNTVPELIAKYCLDALKQILGKHKLVKADNGTEHSITEPLHTYFSEVKYGFQINHLFNEVFYF